MHGQTRKKKIKFLSRLPLIVVVLILAMALVGYLLSARGSSSNTLSPEGVINYNPPTDEEKMAGDKIKDRIASDDNSTSNQNENEGSLDKIAVNPVISAWVQDENGNIRINGFVQGVIERDGTCEYSLIKGGEKVSESRNGMINAQDTTCGQVIVNKGKLSTGQWQTTLRYTSSTSEGVSNEAIIEVK